MNDKELIAALLQRIRELENALEPFAAIGRKQRVEEMGGAYEAAAYALPVSPAARPTIEDFVGFPGG